MSEQTTEEIEREEIEMLLPWYVTGKLDRTDAARVESYLARHPRLAAQLDLIRAERDETVLANEALGRPSATALDRLLASLPAAKPWLAQRIARSALFQRVSDFFAAPTARAYTMCPSANGSLPQNGIGGVVRAAAASRAASSLGQRLDDLQHAVQRWVLLTLDPCKHKAGRVVDIVQR